MREYISESIVLSREPVGELDARFVLFTKRFGKLVAKAKSVRKLASKLVGHLQPGNLVLARVVEKNGLQIVDALQKRRLAYNPRELSALAALLAEMEPESEIWERLAAGGERFCWRELLRILGWDPAEAVCVVCEGEPLAAFRGATQEFLCQNCASRSGGDGLIYI